MKRALLFASIVFASACADKKNTAQVVRKNIQHAVYASGKLYPLNHYTVISKFPGYVEKVAVHPGDSVSTGTLLISIRNEVNALNLESARNLLTLARQNADENGPQLLGLKNEVAAAESKYKLDSLTFSRTAELGKQNAISKQALDQASTQFSISRNNFQHATENFLNSQSRLKIEMQNAQNMLQAQQSNVNDYKILSVMTGKVYDVNPQTGDLVGPQVPLMEIGDPKNFEVELSVDETDVSFIHPGEAAIFTIDAFPDQVFHGIIREIFPKVIAATKTARVKASFDPDGHSFLYTGMSVEANILIEEKKNALVIPREYVRNGNQVKVKGEDSLRTIRKGIEDLQYIEVLEGLRGDEILLK